MHISLDKLKSVKEKYKMTENMKKMKGIFALIQVPFKNSGFDVDYDGFEKLAEYMTTKTGIHGIGLYGMVSEFHKLTDYEKTELTKIFLSAAKRNKVPSYLSITDYSTEVCVNKAREYEKMGVDAIMLLPPSMFNPHIDEIRNHMVSVLEAVEIPVLLQYAPQATGQNIPKEELLAMKDKYENACFKLEFKPAAANLKPYLDEKPDMIILTGYAGLEMIDLYDIGVKGIIPGGSFTELYVAIYDAYFSGDKKKATKLYNKLEPYLKFWMMTPESLLAIEKEVLVRRGKMKESICRRPCYHLTEKDSQDIDKFLVEFNEYLK